MAVATTTTMTTTEVVSPAASSSWTPWLTLGIAGAAVAAGAYYSGGLVLAAPLVQRLAFAWAVGHANEATKHLQFLYPLWGETQEDWKRRVSVLNHEVVEGHLAFRCFYIESANGAGVRDSVPAEAKKDETGTTATLADAPVASKEGDAKVDEKDAAKEEDKSEVSMRVEPTTSEQVTGDADKKAGDDEVKVTATDASTLKADTSTSANTNTNTTNPASATSNAIPPTPPTPPVPRTFINPPPQSVCHLFRPVPSDSPDQIAGHMTMFDRSENAGAYWTMVDEAGVVINQAIRRWKADEAGEMVEVEGAGNSKGLRPAVWREVKVGIVPL
ncbi:hypothetical protein HDU76_001414 [Blyttiomyces sp. JEL0837]|nr:hypothetical protein HDU76_001414 [Blyttiomyces sp. JEL0837]